MSNPTMYEPGAPQRSGCGGTCFKSCLGVAIVLTVLAIVGVIALYVGVNRFLDSILDTEPMALPEVELSPAERQDLDNRIAAFEATLEQPGELATLRLTGDEINVFIRDRLADDDLGRFGDYIYVHIEDGVIRGDISLPLSELPIPFGIGGGRYLNGSATMRMVVDDQEVGLYLEDLQLRERQIPEQYLAELKAQNLLDEYKDDPDFQRFRQAVETFRIEDDAIVISLRVLPESEAEEEETLPADAA